MKVKTIFTAKPLDTHELLQTRTTANGTVLEAGFGGQKFQSSVILKIQQLMSWKHNHRGNFKVMVDGGMNGETAKLVRNAGADVLVAGTFLFRHEHSIAFSARELLQ